MTGSLEVRDGTGSARSDRRASPSTSEIVFADRAQPNARAIPDYEPFTLGEFNDDNPIISNGRLEGPPPRTSDHNGDRSCTLHFSLTQFKRFMLMNNDVKSHVTR